MSNAALHPDTTLDVEDFKNRVAEIQRQPDYEAPFAFALGFATFAKDGAILDTYYPTVNATVDDKLENPGSAAMFAFVTGHLKGDAHYVLDYPQLVRLEALFAAFKDDGKVHANIEVMDAARAMYIKQGAEGRNRAVITFIAKGNTDPKSTPDAYLRLHLLSHRKVQPRGINLNGIFPLLPIVSWTSEGALHPNEVRAHKLKSKIEGKHLHIYSHDKFPPYLDMVAIEDVRIADGARVRLGAHLGSGTTVMHEGFVNFNAGTEAAAMVEGRISAGVFVGKDSDIGGGASIMGTLSGGGKETITIGSNCLLGANSGLGISLGDRCTLQAGLYVTASDMIYVESPEHLELLKEKGVAFLPGGEGHCVTSLALSGMNDMLLLRHSRNGRIILKFNKKPNKLNAVLHAPAPTPAATTA